MIEKPQIWLLSLDEKEEMNYSKQGVNGMFWLMLSQFARLFIILVSTMILVRILPPSDFGLIAMTATVTSFITLFRDAGLVQATIQQTNLTHDQVSTLFWANQLIALLLTIVTLFVSFPIANFYGEDQLVLAIQILAIGLFAGALGSQHDALLRRAMHYRTIAIIEVTSVLLSFIVTIIAAFSGWSFWALVLQRILQLTLFSIGNWIACNWRPGFYWKWKETSEQLGFGAQISLFNFMNYFSRNGDNILIGWQIGPHALGVYAKSYDLLLAPLQQLSAPMSNTLLPILARLRNDPEEYLKLYKNSYGLAALAMFPISTIMVVYPQQLVSVVFGSGWEEAIPVIRWLGVAVATQIVSSGTGTLLISQKRGKDFAFIGTIGSVITVCSFLIGLPYGVGGVAFSYAMCTVFIIQPFNFWWVGKSGPVSFIESYKLMALPAWCSALTWPFLLLSKTWLPENAFIALATGCVLCAASMLLALLIIPQGRIIAKQVLRWALLQNDAKKNQ